MKNKILAFVNKINFEKYLVWILSFYFALLVLPYCFAPIRPLYNVFTNSLVSILIRFIASFTMILYCSLICLKFRPKIKKTYLIIAVFLFICLSFSLILTNPTFISILTHSPFAFMTYVSYNVGIIELIGGYASCIVDLIFGYSFLFILPFVVNKDSIKKFIEIVIIFVLIEIMYSLIFEFKKYISTLMLNNSYGGYDINIRASFISKNQFGAFLIMGFVCSFFAFKFYSKSKISKLYHVCSCFLIACVSLLSLCKTAIIALIFFGIVYLISSLVSLFKKKEIKKICIICIFLVVIVGFAIILNCTSLNTISGFRQIYNLFNITLKKAFSIALNERLETWLYSLSIFKGKHILFGYPKATVYYALRTGTNANNMYAHNGFIQQLLYYGILGPLILIYCYIIIFKNISFLSEKSHRVFYIGTFFAIFSFMMAETEILIVSSSLLVFVFNILFSLVMSESKNNRSLYNVKI